MNPQKICENLFDWFQEQDYKGIDPYLVDQAVFSSKLPFLKQIRSLLKPFHSFIPKSFFTKFKPVLMPKALGLIISGNCSMYHITKDKKYIKENEILIEKLIELRSPNYKNLCWGWPFYHGDSPRYPPNLPIICATTPIGLAILDPKVLEHLKSIAKTIVKDFGYDSFEKEICFYHTPLDKNLVYNSNLFAATFLFTSNLNKELAKKSITYTVNGQNPDGSWNYFGNNKSGKEDKIDNRHTGFILENLMRCGIKNEKGMKFYKEKLMKGPRPKWSVKEEYPCDIHDVTQALITYTIYKDKEAATAVFDFMLKEFFDGKNSFYYKLYKNGKKNKTIFLRWNQAWVYKSIAFYLETFKAV